MALPLQNENRGVIETEEEASFRRVVAHGIELAMAEVQAVRQSLAASDEYSGAADVELMRVLTRLAALKGRV